jgi:serine/threonine protein kinase
VKLGFQEKELNLLIKLLKHKNIINIYNFFIDFNNKQVYILMEKCDWKLDMDLLNSFSFE